ncbi:MAG: ComF family protein [Spirochaetales bacterium]|nr:ComF family protein [Spirochaetales bacterium]
MWIKRCILCGNYIFNGKGYQILFNYCQLNINKIEGNICVKCGLPLISEDRLCLKCRDRKQYYEFNKSVFTYSREIKEIIYQYKFRNRKILAFYLSGQLYNLISKYYPDAVIVPVPGRKIIKKQKGWEHIELICKILEKKYKLTHISLLDRKGNKAQKSLSMELRRENLRKNIIFNPRVNFLPETVILVDDIFTTGNTINECASILKENGVIKIYSATIAVD